MFARRAERRPSRPSAPPSSSSDSSSCWVGGGATAGRDAPRTRVVTPAEDSFGAGDAALFVDSRHRRRLVVLEHGAQFHSHAGTIAHDEIIGGPAAAEHRSTQGARWTVVRPTIEDFVLTMPRGAQVIYPKDLAAMCTFADVGPGMRVFETGVGSGALSIALLRLGAIVTGYEIREDFATRAGRNVRLFLGQGVMDRYSVHLRDSYESVDDAKFDRAMLDLPEPWRVIPHLAGALKPGGVVCAYTPSITQAVTVREALSGDWFDVRTLEVLHRTWHIEGQAVRPDHRMVAHTAFLTIGRRAPSTAR